jgi:hypothetical protein
MVAAKLVAECVSISSDVDPESLAASATNTASNRHRLTPLNGFAIGS